MDDVRIYLKYYSKYSFDEEPFNDVDNVILSFLSYVNYDGIVPTYGNGTISLRDASRLYWDKHSKEETNLNIIAVRRAAYVLKLIEESKRYGDILLYNYEYSVDEGSQFGALCCRLPNGMIYVSFEGTDSLISGWEEDFRLAYMFPTVSQRRAIEYLNRSIGFFDGYVMVGGHSKGGNLAIVSSMYCKSNIKRKIKCIYNNDGPGLRKSEFESKEYKEISDRIRMFVPKDSVVGLLLRHSSNYIVVESTTKGLMQHDSTSWCCYGGHFITCTLSKASQKYEETLLEWVDKYSYEELEKFIDSLFGIFKEAGITDLKELKSSAMKGIIKIISSTKNMDSFTKDMILDFIKLLVID